jgi:mannose-1-phosphate guanylyltransferase
MKTTRRTPAGKSQLRSSKPRRPSSGFGLTSELNDASAKTEKLVSCAVLLAGGRGTRFWPRSRVRTPKQLLNIVGDTTMLRAAMDRLLAVFGARNFWAVTHDEQASAVRKELRGVPPSHILSEPIGRNTAAAIGLAAIHLEHEHGDAVMAVLPSDSYIGDAARYRSIVHAALDVAREPNHLVVLGVPPARPETGYGYIEKGAAAANATAHAIAGADATPGTGVAPAAKAASALAAALVFAVKRFTEKPNLETACEYAASENYFWNAGMFFWRVSTFLDCLKRFLPATYDGLAQLGKAIGTSRYGAALRRIYPQLENISVDYAIMERATRVEPAAASAGDAGGAVDDRPKVFVIPASVGWSDIGSWAAVYELLAASADANVSAGSSFTIDSAGNYFWSPKKFVAAIGVRDLLVVETDDALLLCSRDRSQDVAKIVKHLEEQKQRKLL